MKESGTFKGATPPEFELRAVKDCIERYREDVLGIKPEWMQDKKESTPAPTRVTDPATKKPLIRPGG